MVGCPRGRCASKCSSCCAGTSKGVHLRGQIYAKSLTRVLTRCEYSMGAASGSGSNAVCLPYDITVIRDIRATMYHILVSYKMQNVPPNKQGIRRSVFGRQNTRNTEIILYYSCTEHTFAFRSARYDICQYGLWKYPFGVEGDGTGRRLDYKEARNTPRPFHSVTLLVSCERGPNRPTERLKKNKHPDISGQMINWWLAGNEH